VHNSGICGHISEISCAKQLFIINSIATTLEPALKYRAQIFSPHSKFMIMWIPTEIIRFCP